MTVLEFPGFIDVHVHFRDPGVPEAETTATGLAAAAAGGFAAVVTMPNTVPPVDAPPMVRRGSAAGGVNLFPSACITKGRAGGEVADLEALAEAGAVMFTDDGTYVADQRVLEEAMRRAAELNMVVSQHALSPEFTEAEAIARDLSVCRETGCRYHVQHLSTAAGVELVRGAVKEGLPVTAEATPHHLLLTRDDIPGLLPGAGASVSAWPGNFRMAPPLATAEDRAELRRAVKEGLLMFATDHAPHPAERKNLPYAEAANGILGLETAVAVTYEVMVTGEGMSAEDWAKAWYELPRAILSPAADLSGLRTTRVAVGEPWTVDVSAFRSKSRNCPYDGMTFNCRSIA